ncbi:FAD:protein FMN transferase [Arcobacter sp. YIC-80]|uniref:FAD:protein FMN transferase n=1 Tax=Arcobacter sp. YIC-80 TaxID=3376683 RepID=UPI00384B8864
MKLFKFTFNAMTTNCEVHLYCENEIIAVECFEKIKQNTYALEKKYNFYDKKSYLNKSINNRSSNIVQVDKLTLEVLSKVKEYSKQTNNLFDITVGTIKKCYEHKKLTKLNNCLATLKNKMGNNTWEIKSNKLNFKYKETKFDLGGVIKEFSVDEAGKIIKEFNIKSALINYGGDILTIGLKPDGQPFSVGIKNPKNPKENLLYINLSNQALTTSANYERSYNIEDNEFSHILNKKDQEEILSSTVISDSTLCSGIFSTSFMIDSNCEINDEIKVALIDENLNVHQNIINQG